MSKVLEKLFSREIYPTTQFLPIATRYISLNDLVNKVDVFAPQQLISALNLEAIDKLEELKPIYLDIFKDFKIPEGNYSSHSFSSSVRHEVSNDDEKNLINRVLREISIPTKYLTPKGEVVVDFDADRCEYLIDLIMENDETEEFADYLNGRLNVYREMVFMKNFIF